MNDPVWNPADHLLDAEDQIESMRPYAALGKRVLEEWSRGCADIDGGWFQDAALEAGVLVRVEVTEPCGENCFCAEWDDFPQTCIRRADRLAARPPETL